jgi:hypothetical protein
VGQAIQPDRGPFVENGWLFQFSLEAPEDYYKLRLLPLYINYVGERGSASNVTRYSSVGSMIFSGAAVILGHRWNYIPAIIAASTVSFKS